MKSRSIRRIRVSLAAALVALAASMAQAGPLDSTLPVLSSGKPAILGTVSGVVNGGGLATFFSCTNQSAISMQMTVGIFVDGGGDPCNDEAAAAVTIPPGGTKLIATQNNADSSYFSTSPASTVDMFIAIGSARILTTGKGAVCSAFVADVSNSPPSSSYALAVAIKGKQR